MITTISLVNIKHHTIIFFRDNFKQLLLEVIFFSFLNGEAPNQGVLVLCLITQSGGRSQDGGGIGRRDHFLFYKFIERTTER